MKKTLLMSMLAIGISVLFVSGVMAQQTPAPAPTAAPQGTKVEKFKGVIEKVDDAKKDVLIKNGKEEMTFSFDNHSKITEGKKEVPFGDLKKGMWASVEFKKEGDKLMAQAINVRMPKVATKKETPAGTKTETPSEKPTGKM